MRVLSVDDFIRCYLSGCGFRLGGDGELQSTTESGTAAEMSNMALCLSPRSRNALERTQQELQARMLAVIGAGSVLEEILPVPLAGMSSREIAGGVICHVFSRMEGAMLNPENLIIRILLTETLNTLPTSSSVNTDLLRCCVEETVRRTPCPSRPSAEAVQAVLRQCADTVYTSYFDISRLATPSGQLNMEDPVVEGALKYFEILQREAEPELEEIFMRYLRDAVTLAFIVPNQSFQQMMEGLVSEAQQIVWDMTEGAQEGAREQIVWDMTEGAQEGTGAAYAATYLEGLAEEFLFPEPATPAAPAVPVIPPPPAAQAMPFVPAVPVIPPAAPAVPAVPAISPLPALPFVPAVPVIPPAAPAVPAVPAISPLPALPFVPAVSLTPPAAPAAPAEPVTPPAPVVWIRLVPIASLPEDARRKVKLAPSMVCPVPPIAPPATAPAAVFSPPAAAPAPPAPTAVPVPEATLSAPAAAPAPPAAAPAADPSTSAAGEQKRAADTPPSSSSPVKKRERKQVERAMAAFGLNLEQLSIQKELSVACFNYTINFDMAYTRLLGVYLYSRVLYAGEKISGSQALSYLKSCCVGLREQFTAAGVPPGDKGIGAASAILRAEIISLLTRCICRINPGFNENIAGYMLTEFLTHNLQPGTKALTVIKGLALDMFNLMLLFQNPFLARSRDRRLDCRNFFIQKTITYSARCLCQGTLLNPAVLESALTELLRECRVEDLPGSPENFVLERGRLVRAAMSELAAGNPSEIVPVGNIVRRVRENALLGAARPSYPQVSEAFLRSMVIAVMRMFPYRYGCVSEKMLEEIYLKELAEVMRAQIAPILAMGEKGRFSPSHPSVKASILCVALEIQAKYPAIPLPLIHNILHVLMSRTPVIGPPGPLLNIARQHRESVEEALLGGGAQLDAYLVYPGIRVIPDLETKLMNAYKNTYPSNADGGCIHEKFYRTCAQGRYYTNSKQAFALRPGQADRSGQIYKIRHMMRKRVPDDSLRGYLTTLSSPDGLDTIIREMIASLQLDDLSAGSMSDLLGSGRIYVLDSQVNWVPFDGELCITQRYYLGLHVRNMVTTQVEAVNLATLTVTFYVNPFQQMSGQNGPVFRLINVSLKSVSFL